LIVERASSLKLEISSESGFVGNESETADA